MIPLLVDLEARWRMHDNGGGWAMVLVMLLFLVAIAAVVVIVLVFLRGSMTTAPTGPASRAVDARAILQERFARGDIDEQDFRSRMRALDEAG